MRIIIDNDQYQLYARTDYALSENTLTNVAVSAGDTTINVVSSNGFATDDYIILEDIGKERAEVRKITVSGNTFTVSALTHAHDNRTRIHRLQYNQVGFYKDDVLIGALIDIVPDFFTKTTATVSDTSLYSIKYYNETSTVSSPVGEQIYGYERNLCSIGDVLQFESQSIVGSKLLDKIDIASRELRSLFISQDQLFGNLSDRDIARLREPVAIRALYYVFLELIKVADDVPSQKVALYSALYDTKIKEILSVITKGNSEITVWGQTRALR